MPERHYQDDTVTLYTGDATDVLTGLPDASVHCVVTSPPYWGLRDYGTGRWTGGDPNCPHIPATGRGSSIAQAKHPNFVAYPAAAAHRGGQPQTCRRCGAARDDRQHGLEPTPQGYIDRLRGVFAQLRRVLVETGTVWLNLGDTYSTAPPRRTTAAEPSPDPVHAAGGHPSQVIPRKNLIGMPWRVAFALQRDGWILRNAIVWHKPNAMPESVLDRLSNSYEMLFLLTTQQRYFFNLDPIREPLAQPKGHQAGTTAMRQTGLRHTAGHPRGRNPGDVWSIPTRPLREAHFAPYPVDLPLRCIAAGCPDGGIVLDPFSGAATTGMAARHLGRCYIGIDLNPEFHDIGLRRLGLAPQQGMAA